VPNHAPCLDRYNTISLCHFAEHNDGATPNHAAAWDAFVAHPARTKRVCGGGTWIFDEPLRWETMQFSSLVGDGQYQSGLVVYPADPNQTALTITDMTDSSIRDLAISGVNCGVGLAIGIGGPGRASDYNETSNLVVSGTNCKYAAFSLTGSGDWRHWGLRVFATDSNDPAPALFLDGAGGQSFYSPEIHCTNPKASLIHNRNTGRVVIHDGYLDANGLDDNRRLLCHMFVEGSVQSFAVVGTSVWGSDGGVQPHHNFAGAGANFEHIEIGPASSLDAHAGMFEPGLVPKDAHILASRPYDPSNDAASSAPGGLRWVAGRCYTGRGDLDGPIVGGAHFGGHPYAGATLIVFDQPFTELPNIQLSVEAGQGRTPGYAKIVSPSASGFILESAEEVHWLASGH
jgi:hypothetical protein